MYDLKVLQCDEISNEILLSPNFLIERKPTGTATGSITPFWIGQKANIIMTLVEIMITFCILRNVIRILILVSLLRGPKS